MRHIVAGQDAAGAFPGALVWQGMFDNSLSGNEWAELERLTITMRGENLLKNRLKYNTS